MLRSKPKALLAAHAAMAEVLEALAAMAAPKEAKAWAVRAVNLTPTPSPLNLTLPPSPLNPTPTRRVATGAEMADSDSMGAVVALEAAAARRAGRGRSRTRE